MPRIKVAPPELRTNFSDDNYWHDLARARKLRLPLWRMRCSLGQMRKWLKKLELTSEDFCMWWLGMPNGNVRLMDFSKANPDWPLRAWVGLMLEYAKEIQGSKEE